MTKEFYFPIPNYENSYYISNLGNIKSITRVIKTKNNKTRIVKGKILKQYLSWNGYLTISLSKNNKTKTWKTHKLIQKIIFPESDSRTNHMDHIDKDKTNNRFDNFRLVTIQQNQFNTRAKGTSSKFKGVTFIKKNNSWRARIEKGKLKIHIGYFKEEKNAAKHYDQKAKKLFGEHAHLNFNDENNCIIFPSMENILSELDKRYEN